ncbi:methyl-accepting chemotaxis protein [Lachnospiraceae bacterium 38-14]|uniref:methyl-accepting chemotaxis protein n=1 Tax=Roseburia sp. 1XD42-69 TaxID=2320088 RepID=UPI000EA368AB|nr:methyl-accepting chemotaxis protein [Roseburia sp. 1XD42-69]RKJ63805.1 methyl-accepting chemotaxis protein [Roseburia sp. 1XD42-69]
MGKKQVVEGKRNRKCRHIGRKVGNVVVIMLSLSIILAVVVCVTMFNKLVRSMQTNVCTSGTNMLQHELERISEDEDINQVLDGLKERMGCEFTIFQGDTRAYSTVTQNGQRVVGTKLASNLCDIVLTQGQSYVGQADILGESYLCSYVPTKNESGEIDGLIFAGISVTDAETATGRIINYAMAISAAVIILCIIFLTFYIKKTVSIPLGKITQAAMEMEQGELGLAEGTEVSIGIRSKDEIGMLGEIFEDTIRRLRSYIGEIADVLEAIAEGDLTKEANQDYMGDFHTIKKSLDSILGALNQTMGQIAASAGHVSNGSDQVSASAQTLAQGATEQASAVTEISTTITGISEDAKRTAEAAEEVGHFVNQAGAQLGISMENVRELSVSMENISNDSKEISTIIATIENIAFQINILALNAAVEAARAGAAGKGFAVVAEEISSLAAKSDEAAKATKELIENSVASITEGGKVMNRVTEALEQTGKLAGNVTVKMEQVVAAVENQTQAMEQVATGVEQISAVVENNSATSQECAAASQEMSSQSGLLKELIYAFRLKNSRR